MSCTFHLTALPLRHPSNTLLLATRDQNLHTCPPAFLMGGLPFLPLAHQKGYIGKLRIFSVLTSKDSTRLFSESCYPYSDRQAFPRKQNLKGGRVGPVGRGWGWGGHWTEVCEETIYG